MSSMLRVLALSTLALCLSLPAFAQEAADVPLPRERPAAPAADTTAPAEPAGPELPRARPAPTAPDAAIPQSPATADPVTPPAEPKVEEPSAPPRDYQVACPAVLNGEVTATSLPPIGWFTITDTGHLAPVAELGIVFLLFLIGLELSPKRLVTMRRLVFGLGVMQVTPGMARRASAVSVALSFRSARNFT